MKKTKIKKINSGELIYLTGSQRDCINYGINCLFSISSKDYPEAKYMLTSLTNSLLTKDGKFICYENMLYWKNIKIKSRILFTDIPCHVDI